MWIAYFKLFVQNVEGEVKPLDISISRSTLQNILQVHTTWWSGTAWNPDLPRTDAEELVAKNNWLDYVCLPSRPASKEAKKITPNDPTRHAVGAVRFGLDLFKQNDVDFLKHFIPGKGQPTSTEMMQLRRLIGADKRERHRAPFEQLLAELPAWFPGPQSIVRDLQRFVEKLEVDPD